MSINRITINGQHYDSPEAMPPDVRRIYDEAMRTAGSSPVSGESGGSTQVFTGQAGHMGASVVVNRSVTVNDRTYGSIDELPPEVRRLYEDSRKGMASRASTTHPKTSLHVSVNLGRRTFDDSSRSTGPLPIEPSSIESRIRDIPMSLAITVAIGLILWFLLGR
jgi:hypothetical protein